MLIMISEPNTIWIRVKDNLKELIPAPSYETFIKPVTLNCIDEDIFIFYLEVPDNIDLDIVNRYRSRLESLIEKLTGKSYKVITKHKSEYSESDDKHSQDNINIGNVVVSKNNNNYNGYFIPTYTFENFVEGSCNKIACAAAHAVAENPSQAYNPLYIYGKSGLGKTHLINAIGLYIQKTKPELNVIYVTSETFTNECTHAIKQNKMNEFKRKYRKADVLLIDDIQFLENKDTTQEEFFHTFNELYKYEKQIIISSDRPPQRLTKLDERLRSRFAWKMMADIQPADYETRIAILMKKAESKGINITDDVYDVIKLVAESIKDNIRNLEGAFNRIVSFSVLLNRDIDVEFAQDILKDIVTSKAATPTPEKIKQIVCNHFDITLDEMDGTKRTNRIAYPRQIAMYISREITDFSLPKIGQCFGGRHYSTVIHAHEKIQKNLKNDESLKEIIDLLIEKSKE
ncbi:MAG: chromosomal replication initiator protein DnaA [Clostridiales bacterium]|nr:chromosomal replication initiator protein DnaA [Clostridiales bacterium]MDY4060188.1 chromosomal replication initiator protein DnaA [Anaerovoracaceae bacterium]